MSRFGHECFLIRVYVHDDLSFSGDSPRSAESQTVQYALDGHYGKDDVTGLLFVQG